MRWLVLNNHFFDVGGLQSISLEIFGELLSRGEEVYFGCFNKNPYKELNRKFPKTSSVRQYGPDIDTRRITFRTITSAINELKKVNPDYLFLCIAGTPDFLPYIVSARLLGIKIVAHAGANGFLPGVTSPDVFYDIHGMFRWWWRNWLKHIFCCYFIGLFLFNNEEQKEHFTRLFKLKSSKGRLWWPPIDLCRFSPSETARLKTRKKLRLENDFVFGTVGNFSEQKGYGNLVEAFGRLSPRKNGLKLIIIGEGPQKQLVQDKVRSLGLERHVLLLGKQYDVENYYNAMDAFALASFDENETLGIVILEAMASGIPCIVTDLPGPARVVQHGDIGNICTRGDIDSLANGMRTLVTDASKQAMFREKGLRFVQRCHISTVVDHFMAAVSSMAH